MSWRTLTVYERDIARFQFGDSLPFEPRYLCLKHTAIFEDVCPQCDLQFALQLDEERFWEA